MGIFSTKQKFYEHMAYDIKKRRNQFVLEEANKFDILYHQLNLNQSFIENILNATVVQLVNMLNQGVITSYKLVIIFSWRTAHFGLQYQMITQTNFSKALQKAKQCDQIRTNSGFKNWTFLTQQKEYLPPLFGIPISVKDTIDMEGFSSTVGATVRYPQKQTKDGLMAEILTKSGMIIFVRSNLSQLTLSYQSVNNLWGRVLNPWNKLRTAGGSSGGQGALISSRCSPIGVGSDVGGSIRIPAQFCGIFGLKPSTNRYSFKGHTQFSASIGGQVNIPYRMGPLGKSAQDLALWVKVITSLQYYKNNPDPYIKIIPFDDQKYKNIEKKIRIGYYYSLDCLPATKASQRAVKQVIQALKNKGHEVIKIQIPEFQYFYMWDEFFTADGTLPIYREMLKGEKVISQYEPGIEMANSWKLLNKFRIYLKKISNPRIGLSMQKCVEKSAYQYLKLSAKQLQLKKKFHQIWKSNQLDIIICPSFGSQAQIHKTSPDILRCGVYVQIWNILEMPAGIVPVTKVRQDEQIYVEKFNDELTLKLVENAKKTKGLPVGVQVVGLPFQEEIVLRTMKLIENQFPFYRQNKFPI